MSSFQGRNPYLKVFSAHLHMDEATPHLHVDFIPFTTGSKRGLIKASRVVPGVTQSGTNGSIRESAAFAGDGAPRH